MPDDDIIHDVMTKVWQAASRVTQFFHGDATKAQMWLEAPNPLLGNFSPLRMLELGRLEKLVEFIEQQLRENERPPEPKVIICPACKGQHIDRDEWATTRVHKLHLCEHCGLVWRPFEYPTVGVAGQPHPVALRELSPHEAAIVAVACPLCAAQIGELCKGEPGYVCIDRVLLVFP